MRFGISWDDVGTHGSLSLRKTHGLAGWLLWLAGRQVATLAIFGCIRAEEPDARPRMGNPPRSTAVILCSGHLSHPLGS